MEARQNAERALEAGAAADEGSGSGAAVAGDGGGVAGIAGAAAAWVRAVRHRHSSHPFVTHGLPLCL